MATKTFQHETWREITSVLCLILHAIFRPPTIAASYSPRHRRYQQETASMADPSIDPRLYASSLPQRTQSQSQSYTAAPQHSAAHPYYLPASNQQQPPQLSQASPLSAALDPALGQASPAIHDDSQDEDGHDGDGDDGCAEFCLTTMTCTKLTCVKGPCNTRFRQNPRRHQTCAGMRFMSRLESSL